MTTINLRNPDSMKACIKTIRELCEKYEAAHGKRPPLDHVIAMEIPLSGVYRPFAVGLYEYDIENNVGRCIDFGYTSTFQNTPDHVYQMMMQMYSRDMSDRAPYSLEEYDPYFIGMAKTYTD